MGYCWRLNLNFMLGAKLGITSKQYNIVTDGLEVNYIPGFKKSYPGTGDDIFNLASGSLTPTGSSIELIDVDSDQNIGDNNGGFNCQDNRECNIKWCKSKS